MAKRNSGKTTIIGTALWVLAGDDKQLQRTMKNATKYINSAYKEITSAVTAFAKYSAAGLAAAGTALAGYVTLAAKSFADYGSQIHDMETATGLTAETVSILGYAAKQAGRSMEDFTPAIRKMSSVIFDARNGSAEAAEVLSRLGVSLAEITAMSPDDAFLRLGRGIFSYGNELDQAAIAQDIFGKSAMNILQLLRDIEASGGFAAVAEEARSLGIVMSSEAAAGADDLGDALERVKTSWQGVSNAIGEQAAPMFKAIYEFLAEAGKQFRQFMDDHQPEIDSIKESLKYIWDKVKEMLPSWEDLKESAGGALSWIDEKLNELTGHYEKNDAGRTVWVEGSMKDYKKLLDPFKALWDTVKGVVKALWDVHEVILAVGIALFVLTSPIGALSLFAVGLAAVYESLKNIGEGGSNFIQRLVDKIEYLKVAIDGLFDMLYDYTAPGWIMKLWDSGLLQGSTAHSSFGTGTGFTDTTGYGDYGSYGNSRVGNAVNFGNVHIDARGTGASPTQLEQAFMRGVERAVRLGKLTPGALAVPGRL